MLVVALELAVVDGTLPPYARVYAWAKLLKPYGAMRWDDLKWVDPATVLLTARGLEATLLRTKTSGAGKKVAVLYLYVCNGAWLGCPEWPACGFDVWKCLCAGAKCMLPLPTVDLQGVESHPCDYIDASAASQAIFRLLNVPVFTEGQGWASSQAPLLEPVTGRYWTGRSERDWLPPYGGGVAPRGRPPVPDRPGVNEPVGRVCPHVE